MRETPWNPNAEFFRSHEQRGLTRPYSHAQSYKISCGLREMFLRFCVSALPLIKQGTKPIAKMPLLGYCPEVRSCPRNPVRCSATDPPVFAGWSGWYWNILKLKLIQRRSWGSRDSPPCPKGLGSSHQKRSRRGESSGEGLAFRHGEGMGNFALQKHRFWWLGYVRIHIY